jgi:hypothetical protein
VAATRGRLLLAVLTQADARLMQAVTPCRGPAPVDPVHRSTVDLTQGLRGLLIWAVRRIGRLRWHVGDGGGGQTAAAAPSGGGGGGLAGEEPRWPPGHHLRRGKHQDEEEEAGKLTQGPEGREPRRRRRSGGAVELRRWAPVWRRCGEGGEEGRAQGEEEARARTL